MKNNLYSSTFTYSSFIKDDHNISSNHMNSFNTIINNFLTDANIFDSLYYYLLTNKSISYTVFQDSTYIKQFLSSLYYNNTDEFVEEIKLIWDDPKPYIEKENILLPNDHTINQHKNDEKK